MTSPGVARLAEADVATRIAALSGWERAGDAIRKHFGFASFREAVAFVNRVADLAEAMDHHPDILVEYRTVTLTLTTHDSGGLTARDFELAARIDG